MSLKSYASILFPRIHAEIVKNPPGFHALFIITISLPMPSNPLALTQPSTPSNPLALTKETWYLLFNPPKIQFTLTQPQIPKDIPIVTIDISQKLLLNFILGGTSGIKLVSNKEILVEGDLNLLVELENLFLGLDGIKKSIQFVTSKL